jgi:hypothetical protein
VKAADESRSSRAYRRIRSHSIPLTSVVPPKYCRLSRLCGAGWHPVRRLATAAVLPGKGTKPIDNRPQLTKLPHNSRYRAPGIIVILNDAVHEHSAPNEREGPRVRKPGPAFVAAQFRAMASLAGPALFQGQTCGSVEVRRWGRDYSSSSLSGLAVDSEGWLATGIRYSSSCQRPISMSRQRSLQNGNQVVPYSTDFLQVGQGTVSGIPNHCNSSAAKADEATVGQVLTCAGLQPRSGGLACYASGSGD